MNQQEKRYFVLHKQFGSAIQTSHDVGCEIGEVASRQTKIAYLSMRGEAKEDGDIRSRREKDVGRLDVAVEELVNTL